MGNLWQTLLRLLGRTLYRKLRPLQAVVNGIFVPTIGLRNVSNALCIPRWALPTRLLTAIILLRGGRLGLCCVVTCSRTLRSPVLTLAMRCMCVLGPLLCWCRNALTHVGLHLWTRLLANIIKLGSVLPTVVLTTWTALWPILGLLRTLVTRSMWNALLLRKCSATFLIAVSCFAWCYISCEAVIMCGVGAVT